MGRGTPCCPLQAATMDSMIRMEYSDPNLSAIGKSPGARKHTYRDPAPDISPSAVGQSASHMRSGRRSYRPEPHVQHATREGALSLRDHRAKVVPGQGFQLDTLEYSIPTCRYLIDRCVSYVSHTRYTICARGTNEAAPS